MVWLQQLRAYYEVWLVSEFLQSLTVQIWDLVRASVSVFQVKFTHGMNGHKSLSALPESNTGKWLEDLMHIPICVEKAFLQGTTQFSAKSCNGLGLKVHLCTDTVVPAVNLFSYYSNPRGWVHNTGIENEFHFSSCSTLHAKESECSHLMWLL